MEDKNLVNNSEDYTDILLTLKEWWGEGSYGYKTIDVLFDGRVLLEEKNTTIDEDGKKEKIERNENIAVLDESDLECLGNIIKFIYNNFNENETTMIFDYGVEITVNYDSSNICIKNEEYLYNQLKKILKAFIEKNTSNTKINYSDIEKNFIKDFLANQK